MGTSCVANAPLDLEDPMHRQVQEDHPVGTTELVPILRLATEGLLRRKPPATGHVPRAATPRQDLVLLSNTSEVTSSLEDRGLRFTHRTGVSRPGRLDIISLFVRIA